MRENTEAFLFYSCLNMQKLQVAKLQSYQTNSCNSMGLYSSCDVGVPPGAGGDREDCGELALQEQLGNQ